MVASVVIAAGCAPLSPSLTEEPIGSSSPSGPPVPSGPGESNAPDISEAIEFREAFGLRSDLSYVLSVAADPSATRVDFGVPLLAAERVALLARTRAAADAREVISQYGVAHPDDFGGVFTDPTSGRVTALFTSRADEHRAALTLLLAPQLTFDVRDARFSLQHLTDLLSRISTDKDGLASLGTQSTGAEVDVPANVVHLWIDSDDPALPDVIRSRFGVGEDLLVTSESDPLSHLPRGSIAGRVVDKNGAPVRVAGMVIEAVGSIAGAEPDGGVGYATSDDGTFLLPRVAAMTWTIRIHPADLRLYDHVLGSASVSVQAGEQAHLVIPITAP